MLWNEKLEHEVYAVPKASLTIYLHVPIEISRKLIKTRLRESKGLKSEVDLHGEDTGYLKRVRDIYIELATSDSNWCTIECTKNHQINSREKIAEKVWSVVGKLLN